MKLRISAKCSDMFNAELIDSNGRVEEYSGYVPEFFPGAHYGDYITLEIDTDTGQILNWTKPSTAQLRTSFPNLQ